MIFFLIDEKKNYSSQTTEKRKREKSKNIGNSG